MYWVYAKNNYGNDNDKYLLYASSMIRYGYNLFSVKLTTELGKAGSLTFTIPAAHPHYDKMYKLSTVVSVYDNKKLIWRGRVLDTRKDFYKNKQVTAEGELAYLNDIWVRDFAQYKDSGVTPENFFTAVMQSYNNSCSSYRAIAKGNFYYSAGKGVTSSGDYGEGNDGPTKIYPYSEDWNDAMSILNEYLLDEIGGYFAIRYDRNDNAYIDYYGQTYIDDFQTKFDGDEVTAKGLCLDQTIQFGKNMLDLEEYIDASEVFTCAIPLGAKTEKDAPPYDYYQERFGIYSLALSTSVGSDTISTSSGEYYMKSELGEKMFGKIYKVLVYDDMDNKTAWEGQTVNNNVVAKRLFNMARFELANAVKMALNITISAVDLRLLGVNTEPMCVGKYVKVLSLPHGINTYYIITKIDLDLLNPDQSTYTLGIDTLSLTDKQVRDKKKLSAANKNTISALSDMLQ